ncbi:hypothetical protein SAMN02745172_02490 [Pseudoxanthobacter soli DSM 19599]|uniref:Uncharacterized protein n=1 Tax=Pseudoxanthobacter soli DSM 19599 TaxID=1123029 RepID=A0A1M7ZLQ9_9HYPH|nr:hypothetical protein [Pseudoxanthobacter soli]SHO65843.1 hypothetical protein SAMN02745172_02490 [Pseudoxanthobacter soli DSM 19599]
MIDHQPPPSGGPETCAATPAASSGIHFIPDEPPAARPLTGLETAALHGAIARWACLMLGAPDITGVPS